MQKKKVFIEIEIPQPVKKRLARIIEKWQQLPIKWSKSESLHITVAFIGFVDESMLPEICEKVSQACQQIDTFDFDLLEIKLAPSVENPQLVSFVGKASDELKELNEKIEKALGIKKHDHKEFHPHITLGRIRKAKWQQLKEKPVIEDKFHAVISVDSVQVMESRGGGAEYVALEHCPLK
jgi:2'-5' RNA ligase